MRKASLMTWVSILALFLGGCQTGDGGEQASQSTPSPQPVAPKPLRKPAPTATPFGSKPLVAQKPGTSTAVAGLIQPELPENVIKRIPQGQRTDPFTAVPVQPQVTVSPNPSAPGASSPRPVPTIPPIPPVKPNVSTPAPRPSAPKTQSPKFKLPPLPKSAPRSNVLPPSRTLSKSPKPSVSKPTKPTKPTNPIGSPVGGAKPSQPLSLPANGPIATAPQIIPELPKLPEPTQARGIQVTGVVEVGGVPMAIVKVPNEPARYVREGQRIANGQVLVKRIEMNQGPEPVVILEQYGIEVARGVGEAPATSPGGPGQTPQGPTASVPYSAPLNTNVPRQA